MQNNLHWFLTVGVRIPRISLVFLLHVQELCHQHNHSSAANHAVFIRSVLHLYNLNEENLICLIGDNCSTNKLLADLMEVPLVGCRSHRLNLAMEAYIKENLVKDC